MTRRLAAPALCLLAVLSLTALAATVALSAGAALAGPATPVAVTPTPSATMVTARAVDALPPQTAAADSFAAWSLDTYSRYRSIGGAQPAPGGRRVIYTLQRLLAEGTGGWACPVTYVAAADGSGRRSLVGGRDSYHASWSPDGRLVAFLSHNANGVANVWVARPGGNARQVTRAAQGVISFAWAPDGGRIAYVAVDMTSAGDGPVVADAHPVRANLWRARPGAQGWLGGRAPAVRRLTDGDFLVPSFDWSPDGRTICYEANTLGEASFSYDSDLILLDVATGNGTPLAVTPAAETRPRYSPDGSRIAYSRSDLPASDFSSWRVVLAPASGSGPEVVLAATPNESPSLLGWCADGRALLFAEYRHTTSVLGVLPADGAPARDVTSASSAVAPTTLSPGARWLAIGVQTWEEPQELSIAKLPADSSDVVAGSLQPRRVTYANTAFAKLPAPRQEVVSWSSDDLTIEGLLTYPVGYEAGKRYPLLLYVHGGPTGAFVNAYAGGRDIYPVAVFAQRGYAVLRVNPRGSDGYGDAFRKANVQDLGGGDFRDLMRGVDDAVARGVADPTRLGIMGWSYGGFMSAWATTQTDRFVAASVGAGPVDWTSMAGTGDMPLLVPDFFGGLPWQVPDLYRDRSPVTFAAEVKTPTLIQHGQWDTRVPYSQGRQWYFTLKSAGVPVTMVSYPRSGHVVEEPALVRDTFQRNLDWFAKYVPAD